MRSDRFRCIAETSGGAAAPAAVRKGVADAVEIGEIGKAADSFQRRMPLFRTSSRVTAAHSEGEALRFRPCQRRGPDRKAWSGRTWCQQDLESASGRKPQSFQCFREQASRPGKKRLAGRCAVGRYRGRGVRAFRCRGRFLGSGGQSGLAFRRERTRTRRRKRHSLRRRNGLRGRG